MAHRSFFTTFEISEICEVNPTSVQNWVKEKKLKAYATPGGHRRVRREDLIAFMKEFGMPIPMELEDKRISILVVDDEEEVRDLLVSVMTDAEEDIEVSTAESGIEALLFIGENKPDLVILDIMLPEMNGIEVCRRLKSNPATHGVRIAAITGAMEPEIQDRILKAGADLFFTKPLDTVKFREECLKLIRS